ncbi:MAG: YihY/virulence factor BrkB family protein [Gemmatimonadaceae bacterium]
MTTTALAASSDPDPAREEPARRWRTSKRPLHQRLLWTVRDYAKRVWDKAGEDNVFFLAGGIAFNILLAAVPFCLLLLSGLGYVLNHSAEQSSAEIWQIVDRLLPPHAETAEAPLHKLLNDIINTRGSVGLYGLIGFIWFSTRLFGSLRAVLAEVFDIEQERGIVAGKLFDTKITIVASLLFVVYTVLTAYINVATSRGVRVLTEYGAHVEVMGRIGYYVGTLTASIFLLLMFFALYKYLPNRRIRWQSAAIAAVFTGFLFELARQLFTSYVRNFDPGSIYAGTLYAIVIVVFWTYYAALIFILGGEVGQVYDLRRVRRLQRETFDH